MEKASPPELGNASFQASGSNGNAGLVASDTSRASWPSPTEPGRPAFSTAGGEGIQGTGGFFPLPAR